MFMVSKQTLETYIIIRLYIMSQQLNKKNVDE